MAYTPTPSNRIASLCEAAGMDRASLAALCGVDERTVYAWEKGNRYIPSAQQSLIADTFGVSVGFLLGRDGAATEDAA